MGQYSPQRADSTPSLLTLSKVTPRPPPPPSPPAPAVHPLLCSHLRCWLLTWGQVKMTCCDLHTESQLKCMPCVAGLPLPSPAWFSKFYHLYENKYCTRQLKRSQLQFMLFNFHFCFYAYNSRVISFYASGLL